MNRDDIIRMAQEAGIRDSTCDGTRGCLERFAVLVADAEAKRMHDEGMVTVGHMREQIAAEREACAKLCEERADGWIKVRHARTIDEGCMHAAAKGEAKALATAIRARSNK